MSSDEFADDGTSRRPKKPPRLRKDGKPDRRKPPKAHQFKPGHSGNPKGRRVGAKGQKAMSEGIDVGAVVLARLTRLIDVKMNGEPVTLPKVDVAIDAVINRVLTKGDHRALEMLLGLMPTKGVSADPSEAAKRAAISAQLAGFLDDVASLKKGIVPRRYRPPEDSDDEPK